MASRAAIGLAVTAVLQAAEADAQTEPPRLPPVEVVGVSPLIGSGVDRDTVPAEVHTLDGAALRRRGMPDLIGTLDQRIGGITLNSASGNPFQPTLFYHGYSVEPLRFTAQERLSPMFDSMLSQGYALIQSGYSAGGWAIEQAAADSERLRRHFIDKHGAPKRTLVMGMSMGGALTAMAIESQPEIYAGAYGKDPEFFAFYRSMQAYETGLNAGGTRFVLTPKSSFFRFFATPTPAPAQTPGTPGSPAASR